MAHFKKAYSQHSVVFFQCNRNSNWLLVQSDVNQEPVLFSAPALHHAAGKAARGSGSGSGDAAQQLAPAALYSIFHTRLWQYVQA